MGEKEIMRTFKQYLEERKYWGTEAAGTIHVAKDTGRILFLLRSGDEDSESGQWEMTIGGRKEETDPDAGATRDREAAEEIGPVANILDTRQIELFFDTGDDHKPFKYNVFVRVMAGEFEPTLSDEHDGWKWVDIAKNEIPSPLHFGAERLLKHPLANKKFIEYRRELN